MTRINGSYSTTRDNVNFTKSIKPFFEHARHSNVNSEIVCETAYSQGLAINNMPKLSKQPKKMHSSSR
jgi:hypothetical protein